MARSLQRRLLGAALAVTLAAAALAQQPAPSQPVPVVPKLKVGDTVPDFTLKVWDGQKLQDIKLSDYRGKKNVILAFFLFAFTGG